MTQAMGFGRAMAMPPSANAYAEGDPAAGATLWDRVDYVGSNSGGTWFATQFFFSNRFFQLVTDYTTPIGDVIVQWFDDYRVGVAKAIARAKHLQVVHDNHLTQTQKMMNSFSHLVLKHTTVPFITEMTAGLIESQLISGGAVEWNAFVANQLDSFTPFMGAPSTTYSNTPRVKQMQNPTLINMAALPPTAWMTDPNFASVTAPYSTNHQLPVGLLPNFAGAGGKVIHGKSFNKLCDFSQCWDGLWKWRCDWKWIFWCRSPNRFHGKGFRVPARVGAARVR